MAGKISTLTVDQILAMTSALWNLGKAMEGINTSLQAQTAAIVQQNLRLSALDDAIAQLANDHTVSATFHAVQQLQSESIGDAMKTHGLLEQIQRAIGPLVAGRGIGLEFPFEGVELQMAVERAVRNKKCPKCGQEPYDGHDMCWNSSQEQAEQRITQQMRQP